jgi:hypothetical protein
LNLIIKNQAEEIKQMKALLELQAKQIEELKKNLESKTTLKDELVEDDLDELLGVFKNQILPETRRPTIKKNVIAGRKSKVVVESDDEDD